VTAATGGLATVCRCRSSPHEGLPGCSPSGGGDSCDGSGIRSQRSSGISASQKLFRSSNLDLHAVDSHLAQAEEDQRSVNRAIAKGSATHFSSYLAASPLRH